MQKHSNNFIFYKDEGKNITREEVEEATKEYLKTKSIRKLESKLDFDGGLRKARFGNSDDDWYQRELRQLQSVAPSNQYDFSKDSISDLFK